MLISPDWPPEERSALLVQMIAAMEEITARERSTLCFCNVVESADTRIAEVLRARNYLRAAEMPTTFLDIKWSSFPEYVRHLRRRHPHTAKNVSREAKLAARAGVMLCELTDPLPLQDRLYALSTGTIAGSTASRFPTMPIFSAR